MQCYKGVMYYSWC